MHEQEYDTGIIGYIRHTLGGQREMDIVSVIFAEFFATGTTAGTTFVSRGTRPFRGGMTANLGAIELRSESAADIYQPVKRQYHAPPNVMSM